MHLSGSNYCSLAYSALTSRSRGISGSASFQSCQKILISHASPCLVARQNIRAGQPNLAQRHDRINIDHALQVKQALKPLHRVTTAPGLEIRIPAK